MQVRDTVYRYSQKCSWVKTCGENIAFCKFFFRELPIVNVGWNLLRAKLAETFLQKVAIPQTFSSAKVSGQMVYNC